ncbi:MAG: hypothetical protein SFU83_17845 [Meiothermus sp.]|nr:hypothetical protein [Meiothermus sp.]
MSDIAQLRLKHHALITALHEFADLLADLNDNPYSRCKALAYRLLREREVVAADECDDPTLLYRDVLFLGYGLKHTATLLEETTNRPAVQARRLAYASANDNRPSSEIDAAVHKAVTERYIEISL